MEHYRAALNHLNSALDEMLVVGETGIIANIAHPISLVEHALLTQQQLIIEAAIRTAQSAST